MFGKKEDTFIIEIGETLLKLWHFSQGNAPKMDLLAVGSFEQVGDVSFSLVLGHFASRFPIRKELLGILIPRASFIYRRMEFPTSNPKELRQMISLQIARLLPYEAADVVFDFTVEKKAATPEISEISLFVIPRTALDQYLNGLTQASMVPAFLSLPTPFLVEAYRSQMPPSLKTALFLDVDSNSVECLAVCDQRLLFSRNFKWQSNTDEAIFDSIQSAVKAVWTEFQLEVECFMTNSAALYQQLQTKMALVYPRAKHVLLDANFLEKKDLLKSSVAQTKNFGVSAAMGFCLLSGHVPLHFLPESVKKEGQKQWRQEQWKKTLFYSACFLLSLAFFGGIDFYMKRKALLQVEGHLGRIREEASLAEKTLQAGRSVAKTDRAKKLPLLVLAEVYDKVPAGIYLTYYEYNQEEGMKIRGMAENVSQVSDLLLQFQNLPYVGRGEIKFAKKRMERGQEFTDFQIDCFLKEALS